MACLGFKPGAAEWYALKKPRPNSGQSYSTLHDRNIRLERTDSNIAYFTNETTELWWPP